ncbi:MAG: Translation initiation factor N-terminal region, partial [Holophagaceae bacterium]|nr:Translation initiation factor N-terminal region [Holophagaceae bacterium]
MLRINQFAKEIGVTNHDVIDVMEKRLAIPGKSHSSNLTDDQISQLRRIFDAKSKGTEESAPLALHRPTAAVKIVKAAPSLPGQAP